MEDKELGRNDRGELRGAWRWVAGTVAVLLTLGVVGGLVYHRLSVRPAGNETVGSASVSGADFSCRLPVLTLGAAGFISFPSGTVTIDRRLSIDPYRGQVTYTYDSPLATWVPVPGPALSPDRRSYAYMAQTTGIPGQTMSVGLHTHEIQSGKDRLLWEASGSPGPDMLAWLPSGIYFVAVMGVPAGPETASFPSVYVSDANRPGPPRRVGPNPAPQARDAGQTPFNVFGDGAAWGMGMRMPKQAVSPNNPPAPGDYGPDRILRMNLGDGSVSTWYVATGTNLVTIVGLDDQGRPIVALLQPSLKAEPQAGEFMEPVARLLILTGPNQTVDISSGNANFHFAGTLWADDHGIWFGSWNSVWLYSKDGGLRQVATIPAGVFPSPTPPATPPGKGGPPAGTPPGMPSYMQGTVVSPAGSCV